MKRVFAALTLTLLCSVALAVSAANATHSNVEGPKQDLVSGAVEASADEVEVQIAVNAVSGSGGEDPRGHVFIRSIGITSPRNSVDVTGEVTCVIVKDNRAVVLGDVKRNKEAEPAWREFYVAIWDNREVSFLNDSATFGIVGGDTFPDETCPRGLVDEVEPTLSVTRGDFIVHDATP